MLFWKESSHDNKESVTSSFDRFISIYLSIYLYISIFPYTYVVCGCATLLLSWFAGQSRLVDKNISC